MLRRCPRLHSHGTWSLEARCTDSLRWSRRDLSPRSFRLANGYSHAPSPSTSKQARTQRMASAPCGHCEQRLGSACTGAATDNADTPFNRAPLDAGFVSCAVRASTKRPTPGVVSTRVPARMARAASSDTPATGRDAIKQASCASHGYDMQPASMASAMKFRHCGPSAADRSSGVARAGVVALMLRLPEGGGAHHSDRVGSLLARSGRYRHKSIAA